jgi:hypothetical protein
MVSAAILDGPYSIARRGGDAGCHRGAQRGFVVPPRRDGVGAVQSSPSMTSVGVGVGVGSGGWWCIEGVEATGLWGVVNASPTVCNGSDGGWRGPLPKAPRGLCAWAQLPAAPEGAGSVGGRGTARGVVWLEAPMWRPKTLLPLRRPTRRANAHCSRGAFGRGLLNPGRSSDRPRGGGADDAPQTCRLNPPRYTTNPRDHDSSCTQQM